MTNKSKFLGMPHGTANARLKKQILFHYVQLAKKDTCIRCDSIIETIDDFSIEHIQPWENISVELFWDLDNIAFSHLKCNRPHKRRGRLAKHCPDGTAWCVGHQDFVSLEMFHSNKSLHNGLQKYCKLCHHKVKGRKPKSSMGRSIDGDATDS